MPRSRALAGPVLIVLLWVLVTSTGVVHSLLLASPASVFRALAEEISTGVILGDLLATLSRMVAGYLLGAVLGIPVGLVLGRWQSFNETFTPVVDFFRSVPITALLPLFLVVFGLGDTAKIAIAAYATVLVVIINTIYGVHHRNETRLRVVRTMGATEFQLFRKVILPEALPHIAAGLRTSLSLALVVVVVSEMFTGSRDGLGRRIYETALVYRIPEMYAAILVTGMLGYSLNVGFLAMERRMIHWTGR